MSEYQFEMRGDWLIKRQRLSAERELVGLVSLSFRCLHCNTHREWRKTDPDEESGCPLCSKLIGCRKDNSFREAP
ncbi:MAG: hypothetical protein H6882_11830 [Rhodobiaceae bacterium]|nr:hypothetical protein [Rhodobiaceae bacterium]